MNSLMFVYRKYPVSQNMTHFFPRKPQRDLHFLLKSYLNVFKPYTILHIIHLLSILPDCDHMFFFNLNCLGHFRGIRRGFSLIT